MISMFTSLMQILLQNQQLFYRVCSRSRKHFWEFKNRRQQHRYLVYEEECLKFNVRHQSKAIKRTKRWRQVDGYFRRERKVKQRNNKRIM